MCGLAGYWTIGDAAAGARAMEGALRHRGPDGGDVWADPAAGIALAHRRLSILDLSDAGAQPMASPSGRYVTVFNGEIYNHLDLRRELEADGPVAWHGHSDTETLVHGIERWGLDETLRRAVGMWAIAVWDRRERRLELARDRFGEKPLYWGWGAGGIVFGSELKALKATPGFANPVDEHALALFLRYAYVPAPHSILAGIYKLEPGVIATITADALAAPAAAPPTVARDGQDAGVRLRRYWSLDAAVAAGPDPRMDDAAAVDGLERHLLDAVRLQSVADVPLGAFLSGGVDSSLIVALMRQVSGDVRTFTIGFAEAGFDEAPYARAVAAHLGTEHTELYVTPADVMALIPQLPTIYDEPFADSSQLPTILVSRLARTRVTVALSGDAGDELLGGYNRHVAADRLHRQWLPGPLRVAAGRALTAIPPRHFDRIAGLPGMPRVSMAGVKAHKLGRMLGSGDDPRAHYRLATGQWPDGVPMPGHAVPRSPVDDLAAGRDHPAERMMQWDMASYLPDDILAKVDRAAMSASLETRVPFLDHRVVEHAWRMPLSAKIRDGRGKWAARRVLDRYVPPALIERPKAGFAIPLGDWLRGPLRGWAEDLLAAQSLHPALDAGTIGARWRQHLAGTHDWGAAIWTVLMFQAWHAVWRAGDDSAVRASMIERAA